MYKKSDVSHAKVASLEGLFMSNLLQRRINIATCWASSRIALMDSIENYEDSYAITQEFREWIVDLENKSDQINTSVLSFPKNLINSLNQKNGEPDEVVEL